MSTIGESGAPSGVRGPRPRARGGGVIVDAPGARDAGSRPRTEPSRGAGVRAGGGPRPGATPARRRRSPHRCGSATRGGGTLLQARDQRLDHGGGGGWRPGARPGRGASASIPALLLGSGRRRPAGHCPTYRAKTAAIAKRDFHPLVPTVARRQGRRAWSRRRWSSAASTCRSSARSARARPGRRRARRRGHRRDLPHERPGTHGVRDPQGPRWRCSTDPSCPGSATGARDPSWRSRGPRSSRGRAGRSRPPWPRAPGSCRAPGRRRRSRRSSA